MAVYKIQNSIHHLRVYYTLGHSGNPPKGEIVQEQEIHVRFPHAFDFHSKQPAEKSCDSALGIIHLAEGVIFTEPAFPAGIRSRMSQDSLKFFFLNP